jgi:hypothetical protein
MAQLGKGGQAGAHPVIPAKAGTQGQPALDPRLCGDDEGGSEVDWQIAAFSKLAP